MSDPSQTGSRGPGGRDYMALLEVHAALDALFARHQEALLDRDPAAAARLLAEFESGIREHIEMEEADLLPIYRQAGPIPGGAPELYLAEHRKILKYLAGFRAALEELGATRPDPQAVIRLLDEEARFKHLMEHHDLRERNLLYPTLNRLTGRP